MEQERMESETLVTQLPARDEAAALEAAGGDADLARELVVTLVQGLPNELSELQGCFLAQDWPTLAATVHRIRGATSYCGAPALDSRLQELEGIAAVGDPERVRLLIGQVEKEAERLTRTVMVTTPW